MMREKIPVQHETKIELEKSGKQAEKWAIEILGGILPRFGFELISTLDSWADLRGKTDFYLLDVRTRLCYCVQFSTNPEIMKGEKGAELMRCGIIPWYVDYFQLEDIYFGYRRKWEKFAEEFLNHFKKAQQILGSRLRRFPISAIS